MSRSRNASEYEDRQVLAESRPADIELPLFSELSPVLELTLTIEEFNIM